MSQPVSAHPDGLLTLTVAIDGELLHMRAAGEVDANSAAQLATALEFALAAGTTRVLVDLDAVTFLDSSGLSVLAQGYRAATATGIELKVSAAGRAPLRALQISGLWQLLGDRGDHASHSNAA
jgi:anti-sigma B factor antagonist